MAISCRLCKAILEVISKTIKITLVRLCCPCPRRGPKNLPNNSSRSKVGPKVGFWGSLKVAQQYTNYYTFDVHLTYLLTCSQGPPETYFGDKF